MVDQIGNMMLEETPVVQQKRSVMWNTEKR